MRVNKIRETSEYGELFDVALPIRFYFNKDGSFDGIDVHVEGASQRDKDLVEELCKKLAEALGIGYFYSVSKENNDENEG